MATRTSSPPAVAQQELLCPQDGQGGLGFALPVDGNQEEPAVRAQAGRRKRGAARRPAPRAVRNGTGPIARVFTALARVLVTAWLGVAHAVGGGVRRIGHTARDLDPEHRRDGAGLFLVGLALVVAASVWWQLPGGIGEFTRTVVAGSVGLLAWFVPLLLCFVAWRNLRDPERNGPAGRQVIGWGALLFGVLGIVHIANGSPTPEMGDTAPLQQAGGAIGFVVSKLLLDLLQTPYVVVPLLLLLALFGVLVVTATPVYQVPARLRELGDRIMGRHVPAEDEPVEEATPATAPSADRRRRDRPGDGRPGVRHPRAGGPRDASGAAAGRTSTRTPSPRAPSRGPRTASSRRRTRRCRHASSSSRCPVTSPTRCPTARCSSPARCTRRAPRPPTTSSSDSPRCSRSSTSTPR